MNDRWKTLFWGSFVPLLVVQMFVLLNDRYWTLVAADNTMHFMWGLSIFLFFVAYLRWKPLDAMLGVGVWQMVWEVIEITGDWVLGTPSNSIHADPFFFDGIADTLVNFGGGLVGWLLIHFTGEPLYERRVQRLRYWFVLVLLGMIPLIIIGAPIAVTYNSSPDLLASAWILIVVAVTALYAFLLEPNNRNRRKEDKEATE